MLHIFWKCFACLTESKQDCLGEKSDLKYRRFCELQDILFYQCFLLYIYATVFIMYIRFVVFHVLFALSQLLFECFLDHSIVVHYVFLFVFFLLVVNLHFSAIANASLDCIGWFFGLSNLTLNSSQGASRTEKILSVLCCYKMRCDHTLFVSMYAVLSPGQLFLWHRGINLETVRDW